MKKVTLSKPFMLDGKEITEIVYDFDKLTGKDILTAESNLHLKHKEHFQIYSQSTHVEVAAIACGIHSEDLSRLPVTDFLEVTACAQFFLLNMDLQEEKESEDL